MSDPIRTPTSIVVLAACPSCSLAQPLRVYLNAELVISDEGSVLALKAKASKAEHLCGQAGLFDEAPEPRTPQELADDVARMPLRDQLAVHAAVDGLRGLREMAEATGTTVTVEALGRSVTFGGRQVDPDTGEILPAYRSLVEDGESLDAALARLEARPDYADVIGSPAGQALLELLKDEPGAFVPFLTPEQLGAVS